MVTDPLLYITPLDLAKRIGRPDRAGRRWVTAQLLAIDGGTGNVLIKIGRKWYTTVERLLRHGGPLRDAAARMTNSKSREAM